MITKEEWRPVKGYEGYYEVSNLGRIRSCNRVIKYNTDFSHFHKSKLLSPKISHYGYLCVTLYKDNKGKFFQVHRLVAIAFISNPNNLPVVNHIDGNKQNNHIGNLEWCTTKENIQHAYKLGLAKDGAKHPKAKLTQSQVEEIRKYYIPRKHGHSTRALAKKYGVNQRVIWDIVNYKRYK